RREPPAPQLLLALGLLEVLAEHARERRVARDIRRMAQLDEGLLLDRMEVGEVLRELFVEGLGHRVPFVLVPGLVPGERAAYRPRCDRPAARAPDARRAV